MSLGRWHTGRELLAACWERQVRTRRGWRSIGPLVVRGFCDRLKNLQVLCSPAQIPRETFADFFESRLTSFFEQMHRGEHHARSADAALRCTAVEEGLLQGMQSIIVCQAFYRDDSRSICLKRGNQATVYQHTVHQDGTRAALAFAAPLLCASQTKFLAQYIEKSRHRIGVDD